MTFDFFSWVAVPFLIFLARIIDVSMGTLRIIYLNKGYKKLAPVLGFFEILIWLLAIRAVMVNLRNVACFIAYAGGFAMGNYVGILIEERLSIGFVMLRIFFKQNWDEFKSFLKKKDIGYTIIQAKGTREHIIILCSVIKRNNLKEIIAKLNKTNPHAFYTIENIKSAKEGVFPLIKKRPFDVLFRKYRKSK